MSASCGKRGKMTSPTAILQEEFEFWSEKKGNDKLFLLESSLLDDGRVQLKLLLDLYEIKLNVPADYPKYELGTNFYCEAPATICIWCNALNEFFFDENKGKMQLENVLERIIETYSAHPRRCSVASSDDDLSEDEMEGLECDNFAEDDPPSDDDKIFTTEWELKIARMKTRWRSKELELRQEMIRNETTDAQRLNISCANEVKQIFSFPAASGILSNDLIDIMQYEQESGIIAIACNDNIFKWVVKLTKFDPKTLLHQDLVELDSVCNCNYVEMLMDFSMDLYPFYPPLVKLIRPKLKGLNNEYLTSFDFLKIFQLSYWNPACSMRNILDKMKRFLQESFRVNLLNRKNDPLTSPAGPYFDVEHALLRLGIVSEICPSRSKDNPAYPEVELQKSLPIVHTTLPGQSTLSFHSTLPHQAEFLKQKFSSLPEADEMIEKDIGFEAGLNPPHHHSKIPKMMAKEAVAKKSNKVAPSQKEYWAKGTGYGHMSRPGWDVKAFVAAKQEKDRQVEKVLCEILTELQKECAKMKLSRMDFNGKMDQHPLQGPLSDRSGSSSSSAASLSEVAEDSDDLLEILKGSSLIPYLEKHLSIDSFLEISRHAVLYKLMVSILKEIANQKSFTPLFTLLPGQKVSLYNLLKRLGDMAQFILNRLNKAAANGCIPGMSQKAKTKMAKFNPIPDARTTTEQMADEKLAKEFSDLLKLVTENLKSLGQLSSESSIADDGGTEDESDEVAMDCNSSVPCLPSTSSHNNEDAILAQAYCKCLKGLQFESWEMEVKGPNCHHFAKSFKNEGQGSQQQVLRVAQELASLSTSLPLDLGSSIFVRTDEDKCTLMRALITGPEETPYSNGCFTFDIHFPRSFPKVPPQVDFITTGGGTVRFNPNLYATGKVCLSLLGTWVGIQGEQWTEMSTILQVLVSIQSLILIAEPFFNEPGYEKMIGTSMGKKSSMNYNNDIKSNCIKYAMIGQLKNPTPGFEEVIRAHFYIKRKKILSEIEEWISRDGVKSEFTTHVSELRSLLLKLEAPNEDVAKLAI